MGLLPRLQHRVHTDAAPAEVWAFVGHPRLWPLIDPLVARVEGSAGAAHADQHLLAVSRLLSLRVPVDVVAAAPGQSLSIEVHAVPGLRQRLQATLVAAVDGGTDIVVSSTLEGPLARAAVVPVWVADELVARLAGWRAGREHRKTAPSRVA